MSRKGQWRTSLMRIAEGVGVVEPGENEVQRETYCSLQVPEKKL